MSTERAFPLYKSHKIVAALHIAAIELHEDGSARIAPVEEGFPSFATPAGWSDRFGGTEDDLGVFVRYDDGFASWSPSKPFDEGYTRLPDPTPGASNPARRAGEDEIEAEIQRKGLNAPRLTPALIDETIVGEAFHVFPGTTLTVCALTLRNGFQVTGESAAASPENFDAELGRKIARDNARNKIWALEGYLLRTRLREMVR